MVSYGSSCDGQKAESEGTDFQLQKLWCHTYAREEQEAGRAQGFLGAQLAKIFKYRHQSMIFY